jgi:hypothetical protein
MSGFKFSDGKTIDAVAITGGVVAGELYRIAGWNGICEVDTDEGETFAMNVDPTALFWVEIPAALAAAAGAILYMPAATGGVGKTALTATTTDKAALKVVVAKDGNNIVGARLLNIS